MGLIFPLATCRASAARSPLRRSERGDDAGTVQARPDTASWRDLAGVSALIEDDERNANNRFAVGAELNRWALTRLLWAGPRQHAGPNLSPFRPATHILAERRLEVPALEVAAGVEVAYVGSPAHRA